MRVVSAARGRWLVLPVLLALATVLSPGAATAALGNNGTVKIDTLPWDSYPNNERHTSCTFQVDFYGYDKGDLFAKIRFSAQPPTGKKILLVAESDIFMGGGTLPVAALTSTPSGSTTSRQRSSRSWHT